MTKYFDIYFQTIFYNLNSDNQLWKQNYIYRKLFSILYKQNRIIKTHFGKQILKNNAHYNTLSKKENKVL